MSGMLEFDFDTAPLWTDPEKIKQLFGDVRRGDILRGRVFAGVASRFLRVYNRQLTLMAPLPVGLMGMIQKEIDALQHGLVEAATMTVYYPHRVCTSFTHREFSHPLINFISSLVCGLNDFSAKS